MHCDMLRLMIMSMLAEIDAAYETFLRAFPAYSSTAVLDGLRNSEYGRLDDRQQVYLDYTGAGLYAASQLRRHHELLEHGVFGNPHSANPTSLATTQLVERARARVLHFFNASPDEYLVVFTQNASGALKLAGESYPFAAGDEYMLTFDNHNSVNGIREFARAAGARITYVPMTPELRIDRSQLSARLRASAGTGNRLFAYPAQSNFSGVKHPLDIIDEAQEHGWDVLLDVAAFVPTNRLDLGSVRPDLVSISFYKMFGYPTGVGALLLRKRMFAKLVRPWFAGGTVKIASVQGDGHFLAGDAAAFEDGTVDYLSLPAVEIGLHHLSAVGIELIGERVRCLTGWLLSELSTLQHSNGRPAVHFHGPANLEQRGGTIAFNFVDPAGHMYDIRRVQELASEVRISLRTGCFCNPGAGEIAFGLSREQIAEFFVGHDGLTFDELRARIHDEFDKEIGAIRVSVGLATNFADVYHFAQFARVFIDRTSADVGRIHLEDYGTVMRDSA